jgi:hypothetical protein
MDRRSKLSGSFRGRRKPRRSWLEDAILPQAEDPLRAMQELAEY